MKSQDVKESHFEAIKILTDLEGNLSTCHYFAISFNGFGRSNQGLRPLCCCYYCCWWWWGYISTKYQHQYMEKAEEEEAADKEARESHKEDGFVRIRCLKHQLSYKLCAASTHHHCQLMCHTHLTYLLSSILKYLQYNHTCIQPVLHFSNGALKSESNIYLILTIILWIH